MTIEMLQYKNCTVLKNNKDYEILWSRGKEVLNFPISQELAERVSKSEKDSLEVMFYCEHHRWPKADELEDLYIEAMDLLYMRQMVITKLASLKKLEEPWGQKFAILLLKN